MRTAILGARVIDPSSGLDRVSDLYLDGGKLVAIGQAPADFTADKTLDAQGLVAAPGLVDLSVALREPGYSRKGSIATETLAAAAGGVTSLCCPPFTKPVLDTPAVAELILDRAREAGHTKVFPIGALSKNLAGEQLAELVALRDTGCVAFGNGLDNFRNSRTLRRALEYAATFDLQVIFHSQDFDLAEGGLAHEGPTASFLGLAGIPESAETVALARDLLLVEATGVRAHFQQISSRESLWLLREAKARGLPVTADVSIHHLLLDESAIEGFNSHCHVIPPLRGAADREALLAAVADGTIDAICSQHQPVGSSSKAAPFPASKPGISGLDSLLPLILKLVAEGALPLHRALDAVTAAPARCLGIQAGQLEAGRPASLCVLAADESRGLASHWLSAGSNSPWRNATLPGVVKLTVCQGKVSWLSD